MASIGDVDVFGLRADLEEARCAFLAEHVRQPAPNQQSWHADLFRAGLEALLAARDLRPVGTGKRIPVPAVSTILRKPDILREPATIARPVAVRLIGADG